MAQDDNYSLGPVPRSARKGVIPLTFIMLGLTFFSASMLAGGKLGAGLSFNEFFLAVFLGNLLLGIYTASLGYIGAKTGLSTHLLARFSFGNKGSWLPSFLLAGTQVGWFGVGVAMFAIFVNKVYSGIDIYLLIALAGTAMTVTMFFGISALTVLSVLAVPSMTILGCYSVWKAITDVGGLETLQNIVPVEPLDFSSALVIVVGSFISAGTLTADFIRFGRSAKGAVFIAMVAFFIGNSLMFIFGAGGAAALGMADISDVMVAQGLIGLAIIILGLNIWTTNNNALYASGLGFSNITGLPSKKLSIFNGIVGTVAALWLYDNFVEWLIFLSSAIPPIGGVLIADYVINRKRYMNFSEAKFVNVNWIAIASVAIGILAGYKLPGIIPVNAVLAAAFSHIVLTLLYKLKSDQKLPEVTNAE